MINGPCSTPNTNTLGTKTYILITLTPKYVAVDRTLHYASRRGGTSASPLDDDADMHVSCALSRTLGCKPSVFALPFR
jgi:hypothetical protein